MLKKVCLCGQSVKLVGKIKMQELEIRRGDAIICVCVGEEQFPDAETMKDMKAFGYKFYMDGKIYKPEKKKQEK